ncbi:MAG: restriction endonuclease subunit S [Sedimentisphaerales bacterium]|jgi:type I restriction enzyme S subunit|nr:restriction endonuclease subunit S [Sedimentisphaerales bacterium]HOH65606.1 restriction endonuclease subunit S [Sedimentisphaerales bacterium]HQN36028.1 restriction endonuclease subunit S [Sedimentisphaerales bacterium]
MITSAIPASKRTAYSAYKPSGVPWLGDVPEHWEVRRLKYTADLINVKVDGADNDLPYTGLEHIESWTGRRITPNGDGTSDGQANLYRRGDVLFGKLRPYLAKAHAADSDGICTGELLVLRPKVVRQKFLVDYVLNPDFVAIVDSSTYGAKMPRANWDFIGNLPALIPPDDEQRAIAAFLDRETVRIDALIEKKRRQIELLQEKRSALISHAVTKGLNPNAPMKDSAIDWLGQIPEHWDAIRVMWVAKLESGHTPDKKVPEYWESCTIPWVSLNDTGYLKEHDYISDTAYHVNELGLANSSARLLPSRAVLFTRDATIGLSAITTRPMAVSQHIIAWLCGEQILPEYLLRVFYAMGQELERLTMGSTIKTIGMPDVRELAIPLPPVPEQRDIVKHIEAGTNSIDTVSSAVAKSVELLREYRTALISSAVTGKIDVREEVAS